MTVTDGQTDGRTSCHGIVCALHTRQSINQPRRAVKIGVIWRRRCSVETRFISRRRPIAKKVRSWIRRECPCNFYRRIFPGSQSQVHPCSLVRWTVSLWNMFHEPVVVWFTAYSSPSCSMSFLYVNVPCVSDCQKTVSHACYRYFVIVVTFIICHLRRTPWNSFHSERIFIDVCYRTV